MMIYHVGYSAYTAASSEDKRHPADPPEMYPILRNRHMHIKHTHTRDPTYKQF